MKGRCDNRSMSNAVARYSAELDAPCRPSGGSGAPDIIYACMHMMAQGKIIDV